MTEPTPSPAVLYGGVLVTIKRSVKTAGGPNPIDEKILVRKLPVRLMKEWCDVQDSEEGMVRLACDKDSAWVESLTDESFVAILDKAFELNSDFLAQYWHRKIARQNVIMPGLYEKAIAKLASPSPPSSQISSPEPG